MMINKIRNNKQYDQVMELIEVYLQKATDGGGFHSLTSEEGDELEGLSHLAEEYEDSVLKLIPFPPSIENIVKSKMEASGMTQKDLAAFLDVKAPKLSQILNGKRKPDLEFLKAVHSKLGI